MTWYNLCMNTREAYKRILSAQKILSDNASPGEKLSAVRKLVKGIRPELDTALMACEREIGAVDNLLTGDVLSLGVQHMPEGTEEEKKRKKVVGYFIDNWNKLKGEVTRVQNELAAANDQSDKSHKQNHWGNILGHVAGPLGLITVIAVGVGLMAATSVTIEIQNKGCGTFEASGTPIAIPGFSLPKGSIPSGASATATLPPLTISVDGTTSKDTLVMKALTFSISFGLPDDITAVTIDGTSLLKKKTEIHLSDSKTHTLVLSCN